MEIAVLVGESPRLCNYMQTSATAGFSFHFKQMKKKLSLINTELDRQGK